jgi:iron-sulfur cluster assembly protein
MSTSKQIEIITREMTIEDIFRKFPQKSPRLAQEMTNLGLHCVGCHASTWETLEAGVMSHGMSTEDVDALVTRLNAILEEVIDSSTISMTPRAAKKFLEILEEEAKQGWGLRFTEKMGGCNGFEYSLDYSEKPAEGDLTLDSHGVEIHVNKASLERLLGCEIDYVEGLYNSGFKISNPNVNSSCSCGSSHGY